MLFFIKYFSIIFCSIYSFIKLLNLPTNKIKLSTSLLFCVNLSIFASILEMFFSYAVFLFIILISFFFLTQYTRISPELSITATIIAYGINYIIFALSALVITISVTICFHISSDSYSHTLFQVLTAFLQFLIVPSLFRIKRLRKGMPFLSNRLNSLLLMFISILSLFLATLIRYADNKQYIIPFLFIFLLALFIYLSWKNNITKTYLDKLKENDIAGLNAELVKTQSKIKELENENQELSKLVHSDNKLVPAMTLAVESFIRDASGLSADAAQTGRQLLADLEQLSSTRKGILREQDHRCHTIPPTGSSVIDNLLKYMQQKAYEASIELDVTLSCSIGDLTEKHIKESELSTLLADLLENALIATSHNNGHHILLTIDIIEKFYTISIFDSGIPFSKEVLSDLGLTRHTTHKEEGGSGIGLVAAFELLRKRGASFIIEEYEPDAGLYSKKISVIFNHLGQYALITCRKEEETDFLKQRADLLVIRKRLSRTASTQS